MTNINLHFENHMIVMKISLNSQNEETNSYSIMQYKLQCIVLMIL